MATSALASCYSNDRAIRIAGRPSERLCEQRRLSEAGLPQSRRAGRGVGAGANPLLAVFSSQVHFVLGAARFVATLVVFLAAARAFVLVRFAAVETLSGRAAGPADRVAEPLLFLGPLDDPARICFETALPSLFSSDLSPLRASLASVFARFELLVLATLYAIPSGVASHTGGGEAERPTIEAAPAGVSPPAAAADQDSRCALNSAGRSGDASMSARSTPGASKSLP